MDSKRLGLARRSGNGAHPRNCRHRARQKDDEERCLRAGCVRHVPKPVDTRALPEIVATVIAESEAKRRDARPA